MYGLFAPEAGCSSFVVPLQLECANKVTDRASDTFLAVVCATALAIAAAHVVIERFDRIITHLAVFVPLNLVLVLAMVAL